MLCGHGIKGGVESTTGVQVLMKDTLDKFLMAPIECVESVLMQDWLEDFAASEHLNRYWTAVSAASDDEWPKGLTEDGDKLFFNDKLLLPEDRVEALIDP